MDQNKVSRIVQMGTVVMATIATFILRAPVINPDENEGINWKNIFVFIAGLLVLILHDKLKNNLKSSKAIIIVGVLFVVLLAVYETLYYTNSISCYDTRVIISHENVKEDVQEDWARWKKDQDYEHLLKGFQCKPLKIWDYGTLAVPYYGLTTLYLLIVLTFIILIFSISDKLIIAKDETKSNI